MPSVYNKLGISFQYPENWTLDEEGARAGQKSVTVYSPGGGFLSISVHPTSVDPRGLAQAAVEAMKEEYAEVEAESAEETIAGWEAVGFDLNFYYLDLTNTAQVRCVRTDHATYAIFSQAEDQEFHRIGIVFRAVATSFLDGMPPP